MFSNKFKKKVREFLIVSACMIAGGAILVVAGTWSDYSRHSSSQSK
jgi:hypothetical protein